jgi:hypothetical protein
MWARLGRDVEPLQRLVLTHMMQAANHSDGKREVFVPGEGRRTLRAGELVTSCVRLADETGLSERTIRRYLIALADRWAWLTIRACPGRAGSAGVYVRIDSAAAAAWGVQDRTESPVSARPDTESGVDRTQSPVSVNLDRTQSPIQEERFRQERCSEEREQARRCKTESRGQVHARARSADDHGALEAKQQTANGSRQRPRGADDWESITASWPCRDDADNVARSRAEGLYLRNPVRALAIALGIKRSKPAREWRAFAHRSTAKAYPTADEDMREAARVLNRGGSGGIGAMDEVIDSALAFVAGAREARPPP